MNHSLLSFQLSCQCLSQTHADGVLVSGLVCRSRVGFFSTGSSLFFPGCVEPQHKSLEVLMRRHWRHFVAHLSCFHITQSVHSLTAIVVVVFVETFRCVRMCTSVNATTVRGLIHVDLWRPATPQPSSIQNIENDFESSSQS